MYLKFKNEDGSEHGSFEVFFHAKSAKPDPDSTLGEPGFYWWSCFPGCTPDGEPAGPFNTLAEAISDAQGGN